MRNLVRLCCALAVAALITAASSPTAFRTSARARVVAGTITVNSTSDPVTDDGLCTLPEAITSAIFDVPSGASAGECAAGSGDDTITFTVTGTINLTHSLPDLFGNINITGPGSGNLTVRRDTGGDYRIFTVSNGANVNISGLTVTNGRTPDGTPANSGGNGVDGGGVANFGTLTLAGVTVTANAAGAGGAGISFGGRGGSGGGVYNSTSSTLTMTDCTVTGNSAGGGGTGNNGGGEGGSGGGVFNQGKLTMTSCVVSGNATGRGGDCPNFAGRGGDGGGVLSMFDTAELNEVAINDNTAGDSGTGNGGFGGMGGGIMVRGVSSMTLTNSTVSGNKSGNSPGGTNGFGGGAMVNGTLFVSGSTFSGNMTGGPGGGLMNQGVGTLKMVNSTVSGNIGGNGIQDDSSTTLWLTNCTVTGNATYGVLSFSGHALIRNTIIAGNGSGPDVSGSYNSQGHNLIGNADDSSGFNVTGDQVGSTATPVNPRLGPLADNGGATKTHALLAGSPAIDAGDDALAKDASNNTLTTDQRGAGFPRFADGPDADTTQTVDIGAFEAHPTVEDIADKSMFEDSTLSFNFNVGDAAAGLASVTAASSNATLVPNNAANISVSGTGSQRTLSVTPAAGLNGTTNVTVTVTAANGRTASDAFVLTVVENDTTTTVTVSNATYDGNPHGGTANVVGAGLNQSLPVFYSGRNGTTYGPVTAAPTNAGDYTATATYAGDSNYSPSSDSKNFSIAKADQTITFDAIPGKTFGDPDFTINATASSGLPVSFGNIQGSSCTVTGNTVHINSAQRCRITATQFGDSNYNGAPAVSRDFEIAQATTSVAVSSSVNPSAVGQSVTFTATVTSPAGFVPNGILGTVNFAADGVTIPNCASLLSASGQGSCTTSALPAGRHAITAEYGTTSQNFTGSTGTLQGGQLVGSLFEFGQASYTVAEGASLTVTVTRAGNTTQAASVGYATDDGSTPSAVVPCASVTGLALDRCDYTKALGTLHFAAGETSKTFQILVGDDSYAEGPETAHISLSDASGASGLGTATSAAFTITDDSPESAGNTIDDTDDFVRQHYRDFLNREPDAPGLAFWTNEIDKCGTDQQCREVKRIHVSAAFFLSIEFQRTGYFVYKANKIAYGDATSPNVAGTVPAVRLDEFLADSQRVGQDVIVGQGNWQQVLDANMTALMLDFVQRPKFTTAFPASMTAEQFVTKIEQNAGITLTQIDRDGFIARLAPAPNDPAQRAEVVRAVTGIGELHQAELNRAFVLMQYFGYLRRNPDDAPQMGLNYSGWKFWLDKLNSFNGDFVKAELVKAFLASDEYRKRFGQ